MDRKARILDLKLKIKSKNIFAGITKSNIKGNGLDFNNLREYSPSDDVKKIDWIISARERKPYIREYDEEKDLKFIFVLDVGIDMGFKMGEKSKFQTLEEVFDILSFSALSAGHKVGALFFDEKDVEFVPAKTGKSSILGAKKRLKIRENESNLKKANEYLRTLKLKNSVIFYLTDNTDFEDLPSLKHLSLRNDIFYINIFDSFENNLEGKSGIILSSGSSNSFVTLAGGNKKYADYRREKLDKFRKKLGKEQIGYIEIDEKSNIYKTLLSYFSK